MGRPKRVNFDTFHLYDKLHTKKTKMMCGVEMTTLYAIKETALYYLSIEVWAYCASKFKAKKKGFKLNVDIPVIENEKTCAFLDKHCWKDWVAKDRGDKHSDIPETVALLDKLFPGKEKIFFYELDSLISAYNCGSLISYNDDGSIEEPSNHDIESQKYYNAKYNRHIQTPELTKLRTKWTSEKDEKLKNKYLKEYVNAEHNYAYKYHNCIDTLIDIGKHSVCYPVAFSRGTAEWSKEKYGKEIAYAKAGEIFFVQTKDKIYFEIKRHF